VKYFPRLFISIFHLLVVTNFPQWNNQNPVPDGNVLRSIFFINDDIGWIVGSNGFITKTTNRGVDWIRQKSGTTSYLKSIIFVDQDNGWIVGEDGIILRSSDGGISWIPQISGVDITLNTVEFLNLNTGWAAGYNGTFLKTSDGGQNWYLNSNLGTTDPIFSINFFDENIGWIVGGNPFLSNLTSIILKTTDGGVSFIAQSSGTENALYSVDFINKDLGYAVGTDNVILKTTNGGNIWLSVNDFNSYDKSSGIQDTKQFIDGIGGLRSVFFIDENHGWVAGGENEYDKKLYSTSNGGLTWELKYYGLEEWDFFSLFVTPSGNGWAVGDGGNIFISIDNGDSWKRQLSGSGCCNADDINSIFFINENIGWAVGKRNDWISGQSLILKTTNSGKSWITQFNDYSEAFSTVYFIDKFRGWAAGDNILTTSNGGSTWMQISDSFDKIKSIKFFDENIGFIICSGSESGIYKSFDGGYSWSNKNRSGGNSIFFLNTSLGWAAGANGLVLKSTDGGESWLPKNSGTSYELNQIIFYDANIGICVGENGIILLSTDSGESWTIKSSGTNEELKSTCFTNSNIIWATGSKGKILNSTDQGSTWVADTSLTRNTINTIYFVNEYTGWVGGLNGAIFKYSEYPLPVELVSFTANVNGNTVCLNWDTVTETNNLGFYIERLIPNNNISWETVTFIAGNGTSTVHNKYSFYDHFDTPCNISYRLKQVDYNGQFIYSNIIEVEITASEFVLYQNYPNPFNPGTIINYNLPVAGYVTLKIFNSLGQVIETLVDEYQEAGLYSKLYTVNSTLSNGIYFYQLKTGNFITTNKMSYLK
jgi:photosystem II stability/assembly factor-like uncharacterized protein